MKRFSVIIALLLSIFSFSCTSQPKKTIWTEAYRQGLYNYLDSVSKPGIPDDKKRLRYVEFIMMRFQQELPNGINSIPKDSLRTLYNKLNLEYGAQEYGTGNAAIKPLYYKWSADIEKNFRDDYITLFHDKYPNTVNKFCDCVIEKLKKIYPDSILLPMPNDINMKASMECKPILTSQ